MSNITKVFDNINDSDISLVVYDRSSADSIFGAAVIKFICEKITDAAEEVIVKEISEPIGSTSYKNITFIGCTPNNFTLSELSAQYGELLLFVTCDHNEFVNIRTYAKKASIEYSENDSCALNLYKIAFGEFEDVIPDVFKIVSAYYTKNYDKDYYDGLAFSNVFVDDFVDFDTFYTDIAEPILTGESDMLEYANSTISKMIDDGYMGLEVIEDEIVRHLPVILSDKYRVCGVLNAIAIYSNGPIRDSFIYNYVQKDITVNDDSMDEPIGVDAPELSYVAVPDEKFDDVDALLVFYRNSALEWAVELIKINRDYSNKIDELNAEISIIDDKINAANDLNINTYSLTKERKSLIAEKDTYTKLDRFSAGDYLKKRYKGKGNSEHGYASISSRTFRKIIETKVL